MGKKHYQNMTTPWRGAAPPGRRQDLVQMDRFGHFRTKCVSQDVLTATGPPGYHFKHLFRHFSTTALPARTRAAKMAKKHVCSWKAWFLRLRITLGGTQNRFFVPKNKF
jgi:hypothetical protein